ncbi:hypothetical protein B7494_g4514 [Chlorociboria aeruginascens]|nr:hypothetical protein B7494_g4514 [Chlorociboria aeruginascens]
MPPKKPTAAANATAIQPRKSSRTPKPSSRAASIALDAEPKATKSTAGKRKASIDPADAIDGEKKSKKVKATTTTVEKKGGQPKKAAGSVTSRASKTKITAKKTVATKNNDAPVEKAAAVPKTKPAAKKAVEKADDVLKKSRPSNKVTKAKKATHTPKPTAKAAPKNSKASKATSKAGTAINFAPTQKLDVYVFGEGSQGELGLGAAKYDGKRPIDVKRPRINHLLSAKDVGVVQIAVGGMHCAALTHDNKILTWGVNDQGALGRVTTAGPMKEINEKGEDSDSESEDGENLNPSEAEPREVDSNYFPQGTQFVGLVASDSATFALTAQGNGNDGILGFKKGVETQQTPILIPELKKIKSLASGTNHILALNDKGRIFAWGAGEQNQLARRVVSRTAVGALTPREFGLQRKKIIQIGCGDYHSFAIDDKGDVYAWGLNVFGQTGIEKRTEEDSAIETPTLVECLKDVDVKQILGGAHHTLTCTKTGEVLIFGRIDNSQGGMDTSDFPADSVFFDEEKRPRYLTKPVQVPGIVGEFVSAATDTCVVVDKEGKAWSWGFSGNYQTGQGTTVDVKKATVIDNSAIKEKKLCFAGAGGQFSVLAGAADVQ